MEWCSLCRCCCCLRCYCYSRHPGYCTVRSRSAVLAVGLFAVGCFARQLLVAEVLSPTTVQCKVVVEGVVECAPEVGEEEVAVGDKIAVVVCLVPVQQTE